MSHLNLSPTSLRRLRRAAPARRQRGFSLLEALVSIVVLSFGLLGVAGLQATSLKYSRDARNQSVAVNLAREMAEMIRSNARVGGKMDAASNPYLEPYESGPVDLSNLPAASKPTAAKQLGPFTDSATKTAAEQLAAAQVADWQWRVGEALPGAVATVCIDSQPYEPLTATPNEIRGLPHWDCDDAGNIIVIKLGWEREGTEGVVQSATGKRKDRNGNFTDEDIRPFVVLPVTPAGQE